MVFNSNFTLESLQVRRRKRETGRDRERENKREREIDREVEAKLGIYFRPKSLGWSWNISAFYKLPG